MPVTNMRQPPESGRIAFMGRRFQFSSRCLFVIVTAFCVWLGFQANSAQKQRAAVAKIESVGGIVQYDWQPDLTDWEQVGGARCQPRGEPQAPRWLRRLVGDEPFQDVRSIVLRAGRAYWFRVESGKSFVNSSPGGDSVHLDGDGEGLIPYLKVLPHLKTIYIEKRDGIWESVQLKRKLQQELPGCKIELLDGMTASAGEATEADEMKFVNRRNGARGRRRKMPGS